MEIRALRAFVEVVRQGGFSRAAEVVFTTQSTVSKAVRQLEDELGFKLLERVGQRSRLTEAGEIVYRRALAMLAQQEDLKTELEELRGLAGGKLRLGFPLIGSSILFARWFAAYRSQYPGVDLRLMEHGSKRLEELVLAGELDLAASLLPVGDEFAWQELRREPVDLLLAADHPLAVRESVTFAELAELPFILYSEGFALTPLIMNACREAGFSPRVATRSSQIDLIIELVATGLGVAFLPRIIAELRPHPATRRIPVGEPEIYWHMAMIWRRNGYLSHAAQAWLAMANSPDVSSG